MLLFGSVYDEVNTSPAAVDICFATKQCRFFLGDRWIYVGEVSLTAKGYAMEVGMPDVEAFLLGRLDLDDGTQEWLDWGPQVN